MRPQSLRDSVDITESLTSETFGFGVRESAAFIVSDPRLDMKSQFVVDVRIRVCSEEPQIAPPRVVHATSLRTKRMNWIDARCAPSRDVGRDEDHDHQQRRGGGERDWVSGADLEQLR